MVVSLPLTVLAVRVLLIVGTPGSAILFPVQYISNRWPVPSALRIAKLKVLFIFLKLVIVPGITLIGTLMDCPAGIV